MFFTIYQKQFLRILTLGVRGWWKSFLNLLLVLSLFSFFTSFRLSIFKTPRSIALAILILRGLLVSFIATSSRFWFSYILFLVYVGGLLVIFIYVCLVRRNFPFKLRVSRTAFRLGLAILFWVSISSPDLKTYIGYNSWSCGSDLVSDLNLSLFLALTILLLVILLVVVRRTGAGSLKVNA